ncbi:Uncharacterized protein GBIM_06923, partial [Gryllus bimaculatus]
TVNIDPRTFLGSLIRYRINDFCVGEHTGTHLDAPFHFNKDGWTVEEIPLERLISNGIFMNFSQETANNVSFRLEPDHIDQWIKQHGRLPHNAMVLISYDRGFKVFSMPIKLVNGTGTPARVIIVPEGGILK